MSDIIYTFKNNAYFNITNRCTCKCIFCIRNEHEAIGEATELWHDHNPSFEEIKAAIDDFDFTNYPEAVFCGYGEPTCAYDNLIAAAKYMKKNIRKFSFASIPTDLANSSIKSRSQKKWQNISMPYRSA